jgi:hypothetical protein
MTALFRSTRRPVVYPQAVHARLAATIAAAWGSERFSRPSLPFSSFVRGVALHDRGYGELDVDGIGEISPERWVELQRAGFTPRGDDPVVDLVVALHIHRLVSKPRHPVEAAALPAMEAALPTLRAAAAVSDAEAQAANSITHLCDRIAFDVCCEEPSEWSVRVVPAPGEEPVDVKFAFDGHGLISLSPWPLGLAWLTGIVVGFEAGGYPEALEPVIEVFTIQPA